MQRVFLYPIGMIALFGLAACVLPGAEREEQTSGPADYAAFCAGCHGAGGTGDGAGQQAQGLFGVAHGGLLFGWDVKRHLRDLPLTSQTAGQPMNP